MVSGSFDGASVGKIYDPHVVGNFAFGGARNVISFIAESDSGGATSPCFAVVTPAIEGQIVRVSVEPEYGFAPTSGGNITIRDSGGQVYTGAFVSGGTADVFSAVDPPILNGRPLITIDTLGAASKRARVTLLIVEPVATVAG